jgi:hypothetical protein
MSTPWGLVMIAVRSTGKHSQSVRLAQSYSKVTSSVVLLSQVPDKPLPPLAP